MDRVIVVATVITLAWLRSRWNWVDDCNVHAVSQADTLVRNHEQRGSYYCFIEGNFFLVYCEFVIEKCLLVFLFCFFVRCKIACNRIEGTY